MCFSNFLRSCFKIQKTKKKQQMSILLSLLWNDFVRLVFGIFKFFTGSQLGTKFVEFLV